MWLNVSSRNQWKKKEGQYPPEKWKKNQISQSNPKQRNQDPQRKKPKQKSPGQVYFYFLVIGEHYHLFFFFLLSFNKSSIVHSSLELPYVTPLENKQRRSFSSKGLYPLTNIPKTRPMQKQRCELRKKFFFPLQHFTVVTLPFALILNVFACGVFAVTVDGKLEDRLLDKLLSSSSVPELGHSSSSEGEKEFASPEWDVPLSKNSIRKSRPTIVVSFQSVSLSSLLKI